MKKKNEFSKLLDEVDIKVQKLNEQKKIASRKQKRIESILLANEEKKVRTREEEDKVARKGARKDKIGVIFSLGVVAALFIVPYYRKQPVDFWFYVIGGFCLFGFYQMMKYSK